MPSKSCSPFFLSLVGCLAVLAIAGCSKPDPAAPPVRTVPQVQTEHPQRRTIERTVGQPAFINAYEQTAIYPKIAGYILKWNVDIGDRVERGGVLAELFVPELHAQYDQKKAQATQDVVAISAAQHMVTVAQQNLAVAAAKVDQAKADLGSFEAAVDRWESEVKRLSKLVDEKVVDQQILDESRKQLKSNISQREGADANIAAAQAVTLARQADVEKSKVDVQVAQAQSQVSAADERRYAELVSYTKLTAPYDGVIVARNANTGDYVRTAGGDLSASPGSTDQSPGRAAPIYVVARTDLVRVYVDVPEMDANNIQAGTEATIRVQALDGGEFKGKVSRTSWSLNVQTRTLRAEVDLPNPQAQILPGMYAYAELQIKQSDVMAVPQAAIIELGNQNYCFLLEDGKAIKTPVMSGTSGGSWTEVKMIHTHGRWQPLTGSEQIILGELSRLVDGQKVELVTKSAQAAR